MSQFRVDFSFVLLFLLLFTYTVVPRAASQAHNPSIDMNAFERVLSTPELVDGILNILEPRDLCKILTLDRAFFQHAMPVLWRSVPYRATEYFDETTVNYLPFQQRGHADLLDSLAELLI